jgi:hypothetical protein
MPADEMNVLRQFTRRFEVKDFVKQGQTDKTELGGLGDGFCTNISRLAALSRFNASFSIKPH